MRVWKQELAALTPRGAAWRVLGVALGTATGMLLYERIVVGVSTGDVVAAVVAGISAGFGVGAVIWWAKRRAAAA